VDSSDRPRRSPGRVAAAPPTPALRDESARRVRGWRRAVWLRQTRRRRRDRCRGMHEDQRIKAGVNLAGTLFGPVVNTGLDRPFMLVAARPMAATTTRRGRSSGPTRLLHRFADPASPNSRRAQLPTRRRPRGDRHQSTHTGPSSISAPTSPRSSTRTFVTATVTCSTTPRHASPKCSSCPSVRFQPLQQGMPRSGFQALASGALRVCCPVIGQGPEVRSRPDGPGPEGGVARVR